MVSADNNVINGDGGEEAHPGEPLESFDRWERQQWSIGELELALDLPAWLRLPDFVAAGIKTAIDQFFLGESAVTETLAPILQSAPDAESRFFLCTQLADEARHTLFFLRYIEAVAGHSEGLGSDTYVSDYTDSRWVIAPDHLRSLLDTDLRSVTDDLTRASDPADWYRAVTLYHLLIEGVAAVAGQRTLLEATRQYSGLTMLRGGLQRIARDESRHIGFGVGALRRGVHAGFGEVITAQILSSIGASAWTVLGPDRALPRAMPTAILRGVAHSVERSLTLARGALLGRVERIGLAPAVTPIARAWDTAVEQALDSYASTHGRAHPLRQSTIAAIR